MFALMLECTVIFFVLKFEHIFIYLSIYFERLTHKKIAACVCLSIQYIYTLTAIQANMLELFGDIYPKKDLLLICLDLEIN